MKTPVEIDFQNMAPNSRVRDTIAKHVTQMEERFGRITAGRVVLKAPGGHHKKGGLYEINIMLALPDGHEVIVDHTSQNDERYSDLDFSINDTFKRARRQLQDQVRKLQGQVKHREGPAVGTVVGLDSLGEFGFIETDDGREIYFHRNSVIGGNFPNLTVNARVTYAEEQGEKGPQASTVKLVEKHRLRT
jgi:cold shock CspA family protein